MITRKTTILEATKNKKAVEVLTKHGFHCVGCPFSLMESIEQGAKAHGMNDKQVDEMLKEINNKKGGD